MSADDTSQAIDAVFETLGWRGRYQLQQLTQVLVCIFPIAFHVLSIVFIGKENRHMCRKFDHNVTSQAWPPPDAINMTYGQCSVTWVNVTGETMEAPCPNGLEYAEPIDRSMMSEWSLVCENEALTDVSQTLLLVGMMAGAVLFTSLADKYGRKPLHILCQMGLVVTGVASAFVPSFAAFLPLRFFVGAFQQGTGLCGGILLMEILPARRRFAQSCVGSFLWAVAMVLMTLVSYLMRSLPWRYLQLAYSAFSIYSIVLIWTLDESVRWLMANGRVEETEKILRKAAAVNKVNEADVLNVFRTKALKLLAADKPHEDKHHHKHHHHHHHQRQQHSNHSGEDGGAVNNNSDAPGGPLTPIVEEELPRYNILDFFRHKYVFMCVVINSFTWIVNAMTYYGLSMTSVSLADDMYLGFFLSAVVEIPCSVVFMLLIERIGRKKCCDIFHIIAGLSLLTSVTVSSLAGKTGAVRIIEIVLSLLGKFSISMTFAVIFLFTPEQFPTTLRNASLGMVSMAGRIGGMIAPYSRTLARHVPWGPRVIFGVCCLLVPLLMRALPETTGRELPHTIEQMNHYIKTPYNLKEQQKEKSLHKEKNKSAIV